MRFWRNTSIADARAGPDRDAGRRARSATSGTRTSTTAPPAGARPTVVDHRERAVEILLDYGSTYGAGHGDAPPDALPRTPSGALVFGAGTVQWSWGLDDEHDRGGIDARRPACSRRRSTCSPTWASSRRPCRPGWWPRPPRPTPTPPARRSPRRRTALSVESGQPITISGTATDAGGGVGRRRRGLGRRRHHLAPGAADARAGPTPGRPAATGSVTIRSARGRRQRQPRGPRGGRHRQRRVGDLPLANAAPGERRWRPRRRSRSRRRPRCCRPVEEEELQKDQEQEEAQEVQEKAARLGTRRTK